MNPARTFAVNTGSSVLLSDLGIDPANVLRRAKLPADLLTRESVSLAAREYFAFWDAIQDEAGDPNLPIAIGKAISVESFSPPIFAALCSPNLNIAAERIARYKKLIGPLRVLVSQDKAAMTLELEWPEHLTPPPALVATELIFWVALARIGTRSEVKPLKVRAPEPPGDTKAYREYLGVAIEPGPRQSITFSTQDASRPFLTANEPMWEFFEPELRRRLSDLEAGSGMTEKVHAALLELLPSGNASMEAVVQKLAVSARTLQRRLTDEGTTFQACLNDTREALARHYLSSSRISAAEISFLLGYENPNSFYRAFHSWTGQTPQRVRTAAV